ncbi:MAG: cation transporter, partial [Gammaproteobacteria bacterium]
TALALALLANTLVCAGELLLGWHANSLAVLVDAVHNGGDELALLCLWLAAAGGRRAAQLRAVANVLNTVGILLVALTIAGLALERLAAAPAVAAELTLTAGLAAALGNAAVALALREAARHDGSVRLAFLHNVGDVVLCLSTAGAGVAMLLTGHFWIDAVLAFGVAALLIAGAVRALPGLCRGAVDRVIDQMTSSSSLT